MHLRQQQQLQQQLLKSNNYKDNKEDDNSYFNNSLVFTYSCRGLYLRHHWRDSSALRRKQICQGCTNHYYTWIPFWGHIHWYGTNLQEFKLQHKSFKASGNFLTKTFICKRKLFSAQCDLYWHAYTLQRGGWILQRGIETLGSYNN